MKHRTKYNWNYFCMYSMAKCSVQRNFKTHSKAECSNIQPIVSWRVEQLWQWLNFNCCSQDQPTSTPKRTETSSNILRKSLAYFRMTQNSGKGTSSWERMAPDPLEVCGFNSWLLGKTKVQCIISICLFCARYFWNWSLFIPDPCLASYWVNSCRSKILWFRNNYESHTTLRPPV